MDQSIRHIILRHLRDELSADDQRTLDAWLAASPDNRALFDELSDPDEVAASLDIMDRMNPRAAWQRIQSERADRTRRIFPVRRWTAAAAIVLLVAGAALWYFHSRQASAVPGGGSQAAAQDLRPGGNHALLTLSGGRTIILDSAANGLLAQQGSTHIQKIANGQLTYTTEPAKEAPLTYNTLTTPRGGQYQLVLPDGSKVWLDAASSITYPTAFTGKTRTVTLSGQAYFEVVHRVSQPFTVRVNELEIKDIGTAFNINAYPDEPASKITLIEGSIELDKQAQKIILKPGQQTRVTNGPITIHPSVDIEEVLAWKNGLFQFDRASTAEIMRQAARWYDVDISYEGDVLQHRFSGTVPRASHASALLHILELTRSVSFTIEGRKIIVKPYTK